MSLLLAIAQPALVEERRGGGLPHPGWNRKAWLKKKEREDALEETIRSQWKKLTGQEPEQYVVETASVLATKQEESSNATFISFNAWQAYQFNVLESILAEIHMQEMDDEETLLMLI